MSDLSQPDITIEGGYIICKEEERTPFIIRIDHITKIAFESHRGRNGEVTIFANNNISEDVACTKKQFEELINDIAKIK